MVQSPLLTPELASKLASEQHVESLAFIPSLDLADELIHTYGSPLYVYDGDRLTHTIHTITNAIAYPHTQFRFASVTNGNVALLRLFREAGWGLHANTPGDIFLGLTAGFSPEHIVYSGSNLNRVEMAQVLQWGVSTLNLDSLSQLRLCCEVYQEVSSGKNDPKSAPWDLKESGNFNALKLGLRLNEPSLTGESRIGVQPREFPEAIAIIQSYQNQQHPITLSGLHFYRGTGTNATQSFTDVIDRILAIGQQLPDWRYLDFGGGFGYPYRHGGTTFNWLELGQALTEKLAHFTHQGRSLELVIEPGRAAIAGCAVLLTTVVSTKWQGKKQIVGVDTTVGNLSVPSVHGGYRHIVALKSRQSGTSLEAHDPRHPTDVCGNTTYSRDYLGRNCSLPVLEEGDRLAILDVGEYGYAMSSHFLHRPRPAEVLL
ncbi:MAG: decarboxylase, partial [Merismopedia sp. SIO2A8]|nr:decarboxylase [Merismopedia sp. SIO2A8]